MSQTNVKKTQLLTVQIKNLTTSKNMIHAYISISNIFHNQQGKIGISCFTDHSLPNRGSLKPGEKAPYTVKAILENKCTIRNFKEQRLKCAEKRKTKTNQNTCIAGRKILVDKTSFEKRIPYPNIKIQSNNNKY